MKRAAVSTPTRMKNLPGYRYDGGSKTVFLEVILPETGGKVRRRKTVENVTGDQAVKEWRKFRDEILHPKPPEPAPPSIPTLKSYRESFWKFISGTVAETTRKNETSLLDAVVVPFLGADPIDGLNEARLRDFVVYLRNLDRKKPYSPNTINAMLNIVGRILRDAKARKTIPVLPFDRLPKERKPPLLRLEMKPAERRAFLAALDDADGFSAYLAEHRRFDLAYKHPEKAVAYYFDRFRDAKPFFSIALETGLRRGDLLGLKWSAVHFSKRDPESGMNGWIRLVMHKTAEEATIPISDACKAALDYFRFRRKEDDERIFLTVDGEPFNETKVERYFRVAKDLSGITRRLRFHDLRHTFASDLVSAGVPLEIIRKATGHKSDDMARRYAKPSEESLRSIASALNSRRDELRDELQAPEQKKTAEPGGSK